MGFREFSTPKSSAQEQEFTELLADIKTRHNNVQQMVATGLAVSLAKMLLLVANRRICLIV
jgi:hypothetical protein